jgi:hypothetical protein
MIDLSATTREYTGVRELSASIYLAFEPFSAPSSDIIGFIRR